MQAYKIAIGAAAALLMFGCGLAPDSRGQALRAPAADGAPVLVPVIGLLDDLYDNKDNEKAEEARKAKEARRQARLGKGKAGRAKVRAAPALTGPNMTEKQFGVRSGAMFFPSADITPARRWLVGGYYRFLNKPRMFLEAGIDVGANTGDIAEEDLFMVRINYAFLPFRSMEGDPVPFYVEAGIGAIYEIYNDDDYTGGWLEFGAGYGIQAVGRYWDLRAAYWFLLSSDNADDTVMISIGTGF